MKCIIVDDELPSREELKYFINKFSNIEVEEEFDNGIDALKYISKHKIDVIFLDINMPILDGMEFSKILYKNNTDVKVVFITAYKEYAVEAFEVHAFDYFLKPYSQDRIVSALKRLEESKNENSVSHKISVIRNEKIYVIDTDEIYYIEAQGRGIEVYTKNSKYYSKNKISEIINKLDDKEFYQTHRSYIVNLKKVEEIEPWFNGTYLLKMKDINKEITVSRSNVKELKKMLNF